MILGSKICLLNMLWPQRMIKTWCRYYKRCHAVVHQHTKNAWRKPNGPDFSLRRHRSTFHRFLKMLACFDGLVVTCIFFMYALPVMCSTYKKVKQFFLHTQRRQNVKNLGEAKPIWHPYIIHSGNQPLSFFSLVILLMGSICISF